MNRDHVQLLTHDGLAHSVVCEAAVVVVAWDLGTNELHRPGVGCGSTAALGLREPPPAGKRVRCPRCQNAFIPT